MVRKGERTHTDTEHNFDPRIGRTNLEPGSRTVAPASEKSSPADFHFLPTAQTTPEGKVVILLVPAAIYEAQLEQVIAHRKAVEAHRIRPTDGPFRRNNS